MNAQQQYGICRAKEEYKTALGQRFATTHWSVVLAASQDASPDGLQALEELCGIYWYPLYAYIRRKGYEPHDAQDLTQDFFTRLIQKHYLRDVHPDKGKFRTYLLVCLNNFLHKHWERGKTQKRGGGQAIMSLDVESAERRYVLEPLHTDSPERLFERRWGITILERTMERLRVEYGAKTQLFDALKQYLSGDKENGRYKEIGARLNMSEAAVKKAMQRMRESYREHLRAEIAPTVGSEDEIDDEIMYLFRAVQS